MINTICLGLLCLVPSPEAGDFDLVFAEAQEKWVISVTKHKNLDRVLPHAEAVLVRRLGCPSHAECRDDAAEHLRALGANGLRALAWGQRSIDPEIAHRCRLLMAELFTCGTCQGWGETVCCTDGEREPNSDYCKKHERAPWICSRCADVGDIRDAVRYFRLDKNNWSEREEEDH